MPSRLHEGLTELLRSHPALTTELLSSALGVALPEYDGVRAEPADLTDSDPTEYRADAVLVLRRGESAVLGVVVEVQLSKDPGKHWSWPVYVATLRARLHCPVQLLAVCPRAGVAAWCATPIPLDRAGSQVVPVVLGPDLVPVVTTAEEARRVPELTVLSAIAHGGRIEHRAVLSALMHSLESVEAEHQRPYFRLVHAALPTAARRYLEEIVSTETDEELWSWDRFVLRKGRADGEARAVLRFLDARGIAVPDDRRTLITNCRDVDQLDEWVSRAVTATTIEDLFD